MKALNELICISIMFSMTYGLKVRHYPNVTVEECGIGRESELMDDSCYEWHESIDITSDLKSGRVAQVGEMPFATLIEKPDGYVLYDTSGKGCQVISFYRSCTGSVLNNNWIITAAHCLKCLTEKTCSENEFRIYPGLKDKNQRGNYHTVKRGIISPLYFAIGYGDIALIELNEAIVFTKRFGYYDVNAVCLPESNARDTGMQYAVIAGYGRDGWGYVPRYLYMGWVLIHRPLPFPDNESRQLDVNLIKAPGASHSRRGDSGGPLIHYDKGRAVLIGVTAGTLGKSTNNGEVRTIASRVSADVHWIECEIADRCEKCEYCGLPDANYPLDKK